MKADWRPGRTRRVSPERSRASPGELGKEAETLAPRAWQARLVRFWLKVLSGSLCYKTFGVS